MAPGASGLQPAELAIFFATSNFDLKYFWSLLTYKKAQYLIWKIWFIGFYVGSMYTYFIPYRGKMGIF